MERGAKAPLFHAWCGLSLAWHGQARLSRRAPLPRDASSRGAMAGCPQPSRGLARRGRPIVTAPTWPVTLAGKAARQTSAQIRGIDAVPSPLGRRAGFLAFEFPDRDGMQPEIRG